MHNATSATGGSALGALYEIAVLAAGGRNDPALVARLAAEHASRLLGVEAAALFAWDERAGLLRPVYETPSGASEPAMRPGEGIVGRVFVELAPLKVADYQVFENAVGTSLKRGMRGAMGVPMTVSGRPIGVIGVWSYEVREFTDEDVRLLALFAAHVAPAFEAARLAEERERHVHTMSVLGRVASAAAGLLEEHEIARVTGHAATELFEGASAVLALWDSTRQHLAPFTVGRGRRLPPVAAGEGAMGAAFETGRPVVIDDYEAFPGGVALINDLGVSAMIAVPLVVGEAPIGALGVGFPEPRALAEADVQLVQLLADQVAPALTAARLHADLARSENLLRTVYSAMASGIIVIDARGRILEVNDALLRQAGISRDQLDGRLPGEIAGLELITEAGSIFGPDDSPIDRVLRTGRAVRGAVIGYRRPDCTEFWIQNDCIPVFDAEGRVHRIVNTSIDITAVRTAEAARRESEAKSRFLASMSHELRTPLNSILGFSQLLGQETYGPLTERQRRYVGHIASSGHHLLALVNDILDISKVAAGQMELNTEVVSLAEVAHEVTARLQPLADHGSLQFGHSVSPRLVARADRRRLDQVLYNLLSNAIKFTPDGGRVTLEARRLRDRIVITVSDTGIGIAADQHDRIFEEFTQVEDGRSRRHQGTGLGLAVTRRLVELMGGTITLTSRPGHGSRFTFTLPAASRPRRGTAPGSG